MATTPNPQAPGRALSRATTGFRPERRNLRGENAAQALFTAPRVASPPSRAIVFTLPVAAPLLLAIALVVRWRVFGNPVVQIDEQFYSLVGARMLHGAIPFVDIFDRKPIGLFLIYAAIRVLGGAGVLQYQIVATAFVWATALTLYAMARRVASPGAATAAAAFYIVWLNLAGGEGGQAPVFYTLFVALAAWTTMHAVSEAQAAQGDLRRAGAAAMTLTGLALQIKYSVVFEGLFFGLILLGTSWRCGRPLPVLIGDAAIWVALALLPTGLAALAYARMGHFAAWLYANITSIVDRGSEMPETVASRIAVMGYLVVPLLLAIALRRWTGARPSDPARREGLRFIDMWAASALLGVVLFGTWFNHYALPLFAPFAVAAAPLGDRRFGRAALASFLVIGTGWGQHILYRHTLTRGNASVLAGATAAARGGQGCFFVYDGYPAFYDTTHSCLPTTRAFPAHLQSRNERGATGIDQPTEVARIMAGRPQRVMTMEPAYDEENRTARAALYRGLKGQYRELYRYVGAQHQIVVYGLNGTIPADLQPVEVR